MNTIPHRACSSVNFVAAFSFRQSFKRCAVLFAALIGMAVVAAPAHATHFRGGTVSWVSTGGNSVDIRARTSFRRSFASFSCADPNNPGSTTPCTGPGGFPGVGDLVNTSGSADLIADLGGSNQTEISDVWVVVSIDLANDAMTFDAIQENSLPTIDKNIPYTHNQAGTFIVGIQDCCRISNLSNAANGSYRLTAQVTVGGGSTNSSPVTNIPPFVLCAVNSICNFTVPGSDPDGDALEFEFTPAANGGWPLSPPATNEATIDANTGLFTWNTAAPGPNGAAGASYASQVRVWDLDGNGGRMDYTTADFIILLVDSTGTPPNFDNTPECGATVTGTVGSLISFDVEAADVDNGDNVTLSANGLPSGSSMSPTLPTTGNPVSSTFSWTPGPGDVATHVMTFIAQDDNQNQTQCSVTIEVGAQQILEVTLSSTPAAITEGSDATVTATLNGNADGQITVNLAFSGSAVAADYSVPTQIIIPNGASSAFITLSATADGLDENTETVVIDIDSVVGNATEASQQQTSIDILDNDDAPEVSLSLAGSPFSEDNGQATVTATLSTVSGLPVTVNLGANGASTGTLNTDYTMSGVSILIPAGSMTGSITLDGIPDAIDEDQETAIIEIVGTPTNATAVAPTSVTALINDEDPAPTVSLSLTGSPFSEEGGQATVTATLSAVSGLPVTVNLAATGGDAVLNTDYTMSATSILIPAGSNNGNITLDGLSDNEPEPTEDATISITSVDNGTPASPPGDSVTAQITSDDEDCPVITSNSPPTAASIGDLYSFAFTATDAQGNNTLTLTAPVLPGWLGFTDNGSGSGTLQGTPTGADIGTHNVTLRASDSNTDCDQDLIFQIEVTNENDPPFVAIELPDRLGIVGIPFSHDVSPFFDDPDLQFGDQLTFTQVGLPATLPMNPDGLITGTPEAGDLGPHTVTIRATDQEGLFIDADFTLTIIRQIAGYKCYKSKDARGTPGMEQTTIQLGSRFDNRSVVASKVRSFCAPVSLGGEIINEPNLFMSCYKLKKDNTVTQSKFVKQTVPIADQYVTASHVLIRPAEVCVPSATNGGEPPVLVDSFSCFKSKPAKGTPKTQILGIDTSDALEDRVMDIKGKPKQVCMPTTVDGQGGEDSQDEASFASASPLSAGSMPMVCYKTGPRSKLAPKQAKFVRRHVGIDNYFQTDASHFLKKPYKICLPGILIDDEEEEEEPEGETPE